jgi:NhaP-type Na+/H+ or K+/H+ antiporter
MDIGFAPALLVLGAVLTVAAGLSGWLRGAVLSISVLATTTGAVLSLTGLVTVEAGSPELLHVVELALLLTLFADGMVAERELIRGQWAKPARALTLAMPITAVLIALAAKLLFTALTWPEALLLGAVLAPTDPVVTSTVVTARRVPAVIRHTLNLESGLNDGLALPFVVILLAVSTGSGSTGEEALGQAAETLIGAVAGIAVAVAGDRALDRLPGERITENFEGVYALGLALLAFAVAEVAHGNGLIAAFVSGLSLAYMERELPDAFTRFNENVAAVFQVATFVLFGALIVQISFSGPVLALAAFAAFALLVARPAAVLLSFARSDLSRTHRLFIAWFGPKGVASMLFALYVLQSRAPDRTLVFELAALVVVTSIAAHGLTDTLGARWVERQLDEAPEPERSAEPAAR